MQYFIPAIEVFGGIRPLLLPVYVIAVSLVVGLPMMLTLAFLGGLLWDCQHHVSQVSINQSESFPVVESLTFGYSIILFALAGSFALGFIAYQSKERLVTAVFILTFTLYLYLWGEYLLLNLVRGDFQLNQTVFLKITVTTAISILPTPFILLGLRKLALWCRADVRMIPPLVNLKRKEATV